MLYLTQNDSQQDYQPTPLTSFETFIAETTPDEPLPVSTSSRRYYEPAPATHLETQFRHSFWKEKREKVARGLQDTNLNPRALELFKQCGGECIVEYSPTAKKHRLRANYCRNRHCEPCMKAKGNKIVGNLKKRLEENKDLNFRFITLTLKHTRRPLADQIKHLYTSYKKLRNAKCWKNSQDGGAAMLEVKWSPKTREWHPHLHIISQGNYLDKFDLSKAWLAATGSSTIVDIRKIDAAKDAAHYVGKYITKGTSSEVWNDRQAAQEWILAMRGVRVCATFGKWRGYKLTAAVALFTDWKPVYTLQALFRDVERGDVAAVHLMVSLDGWKLEHETNNRPPPPR
jgi:Replication protein